MNPENWRTAGFAVLGLVVVVLCATVLHVTDTALKEIVSLVKDAILALAGRSAVASLAQGGGITGAIKALVTDAKPGTGA